MFPKSTKEITSPDHFYQGDGMPQWNLWGPSGSYQGYPTWPGTTRAWCDSTASCSPTVAGTAPSPWRSTGTCHWWGWARDIVDRSLTPSVQHPAIFDAAEARFFDCRKRMNRQGDYLKFVYVFVQLFSLKMYTKYKHKFRFEIKFIKF